MNARLPHMQADLIRALANPGRLMILQQLLAGEKTASDLVRLCGLSKANLSQHIKLLKQEGLVQCTKRGTFCHYAIADPRIVQALGLLSDVLHDRLLAAGRDSQSV